MCEATGTWASKALQGVTIRLLGGSDPIDLTSCIIQYGYWALQKTRWPIHGMAARWSSSHDQAKEGPRRWGYAKHYIPITSVYLASGNTGYLLCPMVISPGVRVLHSHHSCLASYLETLCRWLITSDCVHIAYTFRNEY